MTAPTARNYSNVTSRGTLTSSVAPGDATLLTTGFTNTPTVPFTITLDRNTVTEEICLVTGVAGDVLTVSRGYDGTAGVAHLAGAYVEHTAVARDFREANQHTTATEGVHGTTGSLVGTEGSQTLMDKTLLSPIAEADAALGDALVAYVPPGAEARNLFRGMDPDGDDVALIDAFGATILKSVSVSDAPASASSLTRRDYVDAAITTVNAAITGLDTRLDAAEATLATATSSATANSLAKRDANGDSTFGKVFIEDAPGAASHGTRKDYVDTAVAGAVTTAAAAAAVRASGSLVGAAAAVQSLATGVAAVVTGLTGGTALTGDITADTATGKLIAGRAGTYLVFGTMGFAGNSTGRRIVSVYKNGAQIAASASYHVDGVATSVQHGSSPVLVTLAATDYVQVAGAQDSGGNLNALKDFTTIQMILVSE